MNGIDYYIDTICDDVSGFDCGYPNFNDYLRLGLDGDPSVMHYIFETETESLMAYFSVVSSAILFGEPEHFGIIPAIEMKMFALDKRYRGKGYSDILLDGVIKVIRHYATKCVGAHVVFLYSVSAEAVTDLYMRCGFRFFDSNLLVPYESEFTRGCKPMYKVL